MLAMTIFQSLQPLIWGALDVPLFGLGKDLQGVALDPIPAFSLVLDPQQLWFIASDRRPARIHPRARPGVFQAELWKYDVAELFLSDPVSGRYFEFNLTPNGAWWSCEFTAPRVRAEALDIPMPGVETFAEMAPDGAWLAAMAIPLDLLEARIDFGSQTRANVTLVIGAPDSKFVSAVDLGQGEPDFHQPQRFALLHRVPLPEMG